MNGTPQKPASNVASIIAALTGLVAALGVAVNLYITAQHGIVLHQVELQGNSTALEQKRVTAAALSARAAVTHLPEDELKAKDAETVYEKAKEQAAQNTAK